MTTLDEQIPSIRERQEAMPFHGLVDEYLEEATRELIAHLAAEHINPELLQAQAVAVQALVAVRGPV